MRIRKIHILLAAAAAAAAAAGTALVIRSAMWLPGRSHDGALPALTAEEGEIAARLARHVEAIASTPHNTAHPEALEAAARVIERELAAIGLAPQAQRYMAAGQEVRNVWAALPPADTNAITTSDKKPPLFILGAHYDSFGRAPGANDNGTGTAAVLELARLFKAAPPSAVELRFVLFVNEEPPWFGTTEMGSARYAELVRGEGRRVAGMISLETLGAFSDVEGSQEYPIPLGLGLPSKANFIAFVTLPTSRKFLHDVVASFRSHTRFPTIGGVGPWWIDGMAWSDHAPFDERGFPALMITDTALFRYLHYHKPTDTPDKIDYERLARITKGVERVVRDLEGKVVTAEDTSTR
ncbi:MAG: M28 family peptidase [Hyphomicrobiaceae bacterium]